MNNSNNKKFLIFNINPNQKIISVKIDSSKSSLENEKKGALLYEFLKKQSITEISFIENNIKEFSKENKNFFDELILGAQLKSYSFEKYKIYI